MAPRTGRPRSENPRTKMVTARFTEAEHDLVIQAAAIDGTTPGPWMHNQLLAAAMRAQARHRRSATRPAASSD